MNKFLLPTSRKVLPIFRKYCPDGDHGVQSAHFQVQARMAVRHAVTVSLHAVKLMYTATFQWGLKVATHFCVVVRSSSFQIRQIQLAPAVTLHDGRLGCYWGPTASRALCTF